MQLKGNEERELSLHYRWMDDDRDGAEERLTPRI